MKKKENKCLSGMSSSTAEKEKKKLIDPSL